MEYQQKTETVVTLVKVVHYNLKFKPREFPYNDELYVSEINEDGFPIYTMPKKLARLILVAHPDRYRLYMPSKAMHVSYTEPGTGATAYKKLNPWYYTKLTIADGVDDENGEKKYKEVIRWYESLDGSFPKKSVPKVSNVSTPKTQEPDYSYDDLNKLRAETLKALDNEKEKDIYRVAREKCAVEGPTPKKSVLGEFIKSYKEIVKERNAA